MTPRPQTDPYVTGLRMLARRELFSIQIRERLVRKGFTENSVDDAIYRLCLEGAIDDRRAAGAYARYAAEIKSRGRRRTLRELGEFGVNTNDAQEAISEAYAGVSEAALLSRVLCRRLTGPIETQAQFRRLYGALLRQGFEASAVVVALKSKTALTPQFNDE